MKFPKQDKMGKGKKKMEMPMQFPPPMAPKKKKVTKKPKKG